MTSTTPHTAHHHDHDHDAPHDHPHGREHDAGDDEMAQLLDLDAEVLAEHLASIVAWLPVTAAPRRIVDLGCGTGTGTFALLRRFPEAEVVAVDASSHYL